MKNFLGYLFLVFSLTACANDDQTMVVNVNEASFVVTLPANPTTGYQWSVVQYDKNLLTLSSSNFEKPKTNLIGAGGQMQYTFQLQKAKKYPTSTEIQFKYARSWEPKSAVMKKVKVKFVK